MNCDTCPCNTNGNKCGLSKFYEGSVGYECKFRIRYLALVAKKDEPITKEK